MEEEEKEGGERQEMMEEQDCTMNQKKLVEHREGDRE